MHYRINHSIIYTPEDGVVKVVDEDEKGSSSGEISLAPTANRLLAMLISHHGSILQRDELLDSVWDAHGLRASNNSLNQYVSVLRRNFADLGLEDAVIVTIPTVGFMFSKDIPVNVEDAPALSRETVPERVLPAQQNDASDITQAISSANPQSGKTKKGVIAAALILLTALNGGYLLWSSSSTPSFEKNYLLGNVGSCQVYTFYPTASSKKDNYMALVHKSLERAQFRCQPDTDIFFTIEDLALYQQKATMFIAMCSRLKDNQFATCRSYFTN